MSVPAKPRSSKLKYVWIGGALAALALILSPISPFQTQPQAQEGSSSKAGTTAPVDTTPAPQPTNMTDSDLALCSSLTTTVATTIGGQANATAGSNATSMTQTQQVASNLLAGEACNRLSLLHQVSNSSDSGTILVAYGCDAAAGKIGDGALQTDLAMFKSTYCYAATSAIQNSASSLSSDVSSFQATTNSTRVQAQLENITQTVNSATQNVAPGSMYADAQLLSKASGMFATVVQTSSQ